MSDPLLDLLEMQSKVAHAEYVVTCVAISKRAKELKVRALEMQLLPLVEAVQKDCHNIPWGEGIVREPVPLAADEKKDWPAE